MSHWEYLIKTFTSLFIIMGPFSVIPIFISFTANNSKDEKNRMIKKTAITVFSILSFFALFGNLMFKFFGFSLNSFRIAGGLLLLLMAISMLHARRSKIRISEYEEQEGIEKEDISIFPLAIPTIAGPGSISTAVLIAGETSSIGQWIIYLFCIALSVTLITLILKLSQYLHRALGHSGINVLTRLMGLILAAISIEYILQGLSNFISSLG